MARQSYRQDAKSAGIIAALLGVLGVLAVNTSSHAATERTGERFDGADVIERLDVADLPPGVHRFWFRGGGNAIAQGWWVPVVAIKGARPGPRVVLTAGMHGDELSPIAVLHALARETEPATLAGALVLVPGANPPGLLRQSRNWTTTREGEGVNLNRVFPGDATGGSTDRHAERLWTRILRPNADTAVDLHTQSRGAAYPPFVFTDPRLPRTRRMAELLAPDQIKVDAGQKGTVETTFVDAGVPAVTFELGGALAFESAAVRRGVDGVRNLLRDLRMIPSAPTPPAKPPFVGDAGVSVTTTREGWATLLVALNDDVRQGQVVATQADPWGRVVATYTAPVAGRVLIVTTDPMLEPGDRLLRILHDSPDPKCDAGTC